MRSAFRRRGRPDPKAAERPPRPEAAERLLDAVAAERLLDAVAAGVVPESRPAPGDVPDPLARLLAVAAAPTRPGELGGEDAAVAAFRAVRDAQAMADPTTTSRTTGTRDVVPGTPARPPARPRRLTAGAFGWITVVVATLTAGVALAAEIPALRPAGPPPRAPSAEADPTVVGTPAPPTSTPARPQALPGTEPPPTEPGRPRRTPPPQALVAQCRSLLTTGNSGSGPAAGPRPSAALIRAAGGRDKVVDYCRRLLANATEPGNDEPRRPPGKGATPDPPGKPPGREAAGNPSR
ncbi:hypothetical protein ABNF97_22355 [Plantactinospora sp. B6F1]|uniref:hypothetical protein n=1 Tax=Plantactinospora sp. B6F1 TaxID=3158971 RepID=UPI0032D91650